MSNRQWRILFGAITAVCAFLLLQPEVQAIPVLAIVIACINIVAGYIKAPPDPDDPLA
jgi:uncharacterized membrane protein HdeD (DUF308 family)